MHALALAAPAFPAKYVPAGQGAHWLAFVAPLAAENVPARHLRQSTGESLPASGLYVPAEQRMHSAELFAPLRSE